MQVDITCCICGKKVHSSFKCAIVTDYRGVEHEYRMCNSCYVKAVLRRRAKNGTLRW